MPDALTIEFAVRGADRVEKAFSQIAKQSDAAETRLAALMSRSDQASAAYRRLNAEMEKLNRLSQSGGSGPASSFPVPIISRAASPASRAAEALSRLQAKPLFQSRMALESRAASLHSGDNPAGAHMGAAAGKTERGAASRLAGEVEARMTKLFTGARLTGPVAEVAAAVLGPEVMALAGPVGLVVGAASAAATAIFSLAKGAAEASAAFTSFQFQTGSLGAGASSALNTGRQAGLDASGTAGQANALQNAITSSSYGRMVGMKYGVMNLAGPYGSQDYGANYVKVMERMRASSAPLEAKLRDARAMGIDGSLGALTMSDKQYAYGKGDASVHSKIFDSDFAKKSADFNDALGRVGSSVENLMAALGKPFMDDMTTFFDQLASQINGLALFLNGPAGQVLMSGISNLARVLEVLALALTGPAGIVLGQIGGGGIGGGDTGTASAQLKATQDNTAATKENTQRMPGIYGQDTDGRLGKALPDGAGMGAMAAARSTFVKGGVQLGAF